MMKILGYALLIVVGTACSLIVSNMVIAVVEAVKCPPWMALVAVVLCGALLIAWTDTLED